jgi:CRISP-associated protein Cas1
MRSDGVTNLYPIRIHLRVSRKARLGMHHAATVCQLVKRGSASLGWGDAFPSAMIPDILETGRTELHPGDPYSFGLTLFDSAEDAAHRRLSQLLDAVHRIGRSSRAEITGLGGNFDVERAESLVDPQSEYARAIPIDWIDRQVAAARLAQTLTMRWLSPLCASLPKRFGKDAGFFDPKRFPIEDLMQRVLGRLKEQIQFESPNREVTPADISLINPPGTTRLHWISWDYGPPDDRKKLFGAMGRIVVKVTRPDLVRALVLAQYVSIGEKTAFGLGRFVIEETQSVLPPHVPKYLRAARSISLPALAFDLDAVAGEAKRFAIPSEQAVSLAREIVAGSYEPRPVVRFLLEGPRPRLMSVPSRLERVLQRAVLDFLNPTVDKFLTDSCQAYRQGLGRKTAAQRIQTAFRQGRRWALRADFHKFFDSIDHRRLRDKLEVYVQDDDMVDLLMKWVESGSPQPGAGLPTGAVISPMLANLFLDEFDREVEADSGFLVRYADDFVILFRDPALGQKVLALAIEHAERLKLHLNDEKTKLVDLNDTPFDFLGFRFFKEKTWQFHGQGLVQVEDLGWTESAKDRPAAERPKLPGESGAEPTRAGSWIVGPGIDWVGIEGPDIVCKSRQSGQESRFTRNRVSELIVLGAPTIDRSIFLSQEREPMAMLIADDSARFTVALIDEPPFELPELVRAQCAVLDDPARRLAICRQLISAKLSNYATLALAYPARGGSRDLASKLSLRALAAANARDESELLGIEGVGAAQWYGEFARRIDSRFHFERRVHPHADDPVNVMLNLTQTILHRLITLTLIREGFATSIAALHRGGDHHAALASDIQEIFRHLMDRVVIDATSTLSPGEFHQTDQQPFPLRIERGAYRYLVAESLKVLAIQCENTGQSAARSYRRHIATVARSLHRHLLNPEAQFKTFVHR